MELTSPAFSEHAYIPARHAYDGENVSPALEWSGVPAGTSELLLLCEDPDAPSGTFLHWLVTGIDPGQSGVTEGTVPEGARTWTNGFGRVGWGGPMPPPGDKPHRYFFHVCALPGPPSLPSNPTAHDVHRAVDRQALAGGTLVGIYER